MAYKSTVRIVLEVEVPGDQSSGFNFHQYFNMKSGISLLDEESTCLKVENLGTKKTPKEITQSRTIIRGLVNEAFGPDIKAKIKTQNPGAASIFFDVDLFHAENTSNWYSIGSFVYYIKDGAIGVKAPSNARESLIAIADPDLVNKIYLGIRERIKERIEGEKIYGSTSRVASICQKALQCKGPGVTV